MLAYFNGKYLPEDEILISPYERGFQFADGAYEVVRFYYDHFFQTATHLKRMENGLKELRIQKPDLGEFFKIIQNLITKNNLQNTQSLAYIQVTRGACAPRRHWFPPSGTPPTIFISTSVFKPHENEIENGVKVILQPDLRWLRCDIKSISLLPNVLARQQAIENNAAEAVFVRDGFITEGTHTNFCAIKNETLFTAPLSNLILPGVTRQVVLKICENTGISFQQRAIPEDELSNFDELLLVGTTVEIAPIVQVNEQKIGAGKPGRITRFIQEKFYELVKKLE